MSHARNAKIKADAVGLLDSPPEYSPAAANSKPTAKAKQRKAAKTVPVDFDDVQMHLPPPPFGCVVAAKWPELVEALAPLKVKGLDRCMLSVSYTTVKPFLRTAYMKPKYVKIFRDIDYEARQEALMKMDFSHIQQLNKARKDYASSGDKWHAALDARYKEAVAQFETKYGNADADPPPMSKPKPAPTRYVKPDHRKVVSLCYFDKKLD